MHVSVTSIAHFRVKVLVDHLNLVFFDLLVDSVGTPAMEMSFLSACVGVALRQCSNWSQHRDGIFEDNGLILHALVTNHDLSSGVITHLQTSPRINVLIVGLSCSLQMHSFERGLALE